MKIYRCNLCGNILIVNNDGGVNPVCCNKQMELLIPRTDNDLIEKHVPVVNVHKCKITIEVPHVMDEKHYIQTIILETNKGHYLRNLRPSEKPIVEFEISKEESLIAAYEYCNIHGLFKKELNNEEIEGC